MLKYITSEARFVISRLITDVITDVQIQMPEMLTNNEVEELVATKTLKLIGKIWLMTSMLV